jgi:hypothetical protein
MEDQDDPEKRIAELEHQLAEQKRIAELQRQIAQANVGVYGQDVPMPPPAQPSGLKGAWVSVNGSGFQQVSGQGAGAALPPQAAEQLAGLVNNIVRQAEFSGHAGFGTQPAAAGAAGFGVQPGLGYQSPRRKLMGIPLKSVAIGYAVFFVVVFLPALLGVSFFAAMLLTALTPSSVGWMSGIVCESGYQLAADSDSVGRNGHSVTSIEFNCVNGASAYDPGMPAIFGLQTLAVALVTLMLLLCIALAVWLPFRKQSPETALHALLTVLTCGLWAPLWIIAIFRRRGSGAGMYVSR